MKRVIVGSDDSQLSGFAQANSEEEIGGAGAASWQETTVRVFFSLLAGNFEVASLSVKSESGLEWHGGGRLM